MEFVRTRLHIIIATIILVGVLALGLLTGVLNVIEAIVGGVFVLLLIPFMLVLLQHIPKHDNKFRDVEQYRHKR